ncbi:uncharacterized protein LOC124951078 isoform X2 [Vespa velutina]|uniref:uncharacterized protein LOC124951078 isoform X2 n=1 Tax=Vespa velutina TaxID=202808 RepID=UPI001FB45DA9|nr:uncharacterized protein LOC124951078 isoform X2 [Vespa velutina]
MQIFYKNDEMLLTKILFVYVGFCIVLLSMVNSMPQQDEPSFDVPVQLIGFPIIIAAVRVSNFIKKLAYSLNPETYANRTKRMTRLIHDEEILNVGQIEKKLVEKLGNDVCIYERICAKYATKTLQRRSRERVLDWDVIFREYKSSPNPMKENYLLSVFLGDVIGSPRLCHQLAKRGRACDDYTPSD